MRGSLQLCFVRLKFFWVCSALCLFFSYSFLIFAHLTVTCNPSSLLFCLYLPLICGAYFVAFGMVTSELGGLLLCVLNLMVKYSGCCTAKRAGNLCEKVMRQAGLGCAPQGSHKLGDQQCMAGPYCRSVGVGLEVLTAGLGLGRGAGKGREAQ